VSRAHDRELGRDVAIKELISRGRVSEARFLREAHITARLEHPGIVPVHEAGRWPDGTPFYAMKLVAGRPLRDLIAERTRVDQRIGLLHHVIAVADAIAYAHGRNIIHRDLKPANVIVGDFGETVVIDWGLAKDLSEGYEPAIEDSAVRSPDDRDLTATGAILGTPTYMPPEQERGEPVDQRADVFAIGAMLWELCSVHKVPPSDSRLRRRLLRRAGIDQDLVVILEKALHPDPESRYPNAGALATDLKAFTSGSRIAARRYSLWAVLSHWTRRRRSLAIAIATITIAAVASAGLYVRNIATERDRADAALIRAESARDAVLEAQQATVTALANQTLKHAELRLSTDPSAALDVLTTYSGNDTLQSGLLRAEAYGRGIARLRATPHTDTILWIATFPNNSVATLSTDGTIAVTTAAGASSKISQDVVSKDVVAYAAKQRLLAYVCRQDQICVIDFAQTPPAKTQFSHFDPDGLSFSPNGEKLAAVSHDGIAAIWDITNRRQPVELQRIRSSGWKIGFLDDTSLVLLGFHGYTLWQPAHSHVRSELPNIVAVDISYQLHSFVAGTTSGIATLVEARLTGDDVATQNCAKARSTPCASFQMPCALPTDARMERSASGTRNARTRRMPKS
jgi:eukaryotic-like serine/threonine-protein kinase